MYVFFTITLYYYITVVVSCLTVAWLMVAGNLPCIPELSGERGPSHGSLYSALNWERVKELKVSYVLRVCTRYIANNAVSLL